MPEKETGIETLENGNIYFFYRPRVEEENPEAKADLQRLYLVLNPETPKARYRLMIVGRKRMPEPEKSGRERMWGFVEMVRKDSDPVREALGAETYKTKTRGERHEPAARPCGEGVYRILRHDDHTHLVYVLELPRNKDEVQESLDIGAEASYIISVKNPEKRSPRSAGLDEKQKADYPKRLQEVFRGRRFADADPVDFLNREGTEFLLISASGDIREELGIEVDAERESKQSADLFKEMGIEIARRPVAPLLEGEWT